MKQDTTTDKRAVYDVLDRADVLWLAICDDQGPYSVPVNFAREEDLLVLHSSLRGRKADALRSGTVVGFGAAVDIEARMEGELACKLGYSFRSVSGTAAPGELSGDAHRDALRAITIKYSGRDLPLDDRAVRATAVFGLRIRSASARTKE